MKSIATLSFVFSLIFPTIGNSQSIFDDGINSIKAELNKPGFSGNIILIEGYNVLFSETIGLANKEENIPNTLDTRFNIASVGKFLTSLAVFKLASEKGYDINTKQAQDFFPDNTQMFETGVTLGDLLIHRTDVGSILGAENSENLMDQARNNRDIFNLVLSTQSEKIKKIRGELRYANSNFFILGEIIERMSGKPYENYMVENILTPLGATNAVFTKPNASIDNIAQGYVADSFDPESDHGNDQSQTVFPEEYNRIINDPLSDMVSSAAGGLFISAPELAQVMVNLYKSNGVSFETLQAMCTSTIPIPKVIFGYGCNGMEHSPDFINGVTPEEPQE